MTLSQIWHQERQIARLRQLGVDEESITAYRAWLESGSPPGRAYGFGELLLRSVLSAAIGFAIGGPAGAALAFGSTFVLGFASEALAPKPKVGNIQDFGARVTNSTSQLREAISPWRTVYGEVRVSGKMSFVDVTGTGNEFNRLLHIVITLAAHEVDAIGAVYLDDIPIYDEHLDGSGFVTSAHPETRFANNGNAIRIKKHLGTTTQAADTDLVSESARWTTDHRQRGHAYLYVRLRFNSGTLDQLPNISCVVRGKKLLDPRDAGTRWSPNAALVWRDYIADTTVGMGADTTEIASIDAQADICDEMAVVLAVATNLHSVDAATDVLIFDTDLCPYQTGDRVQVSSTGSLPGGLAAATNYFVIALRRQKYERSPNATRPAIKLATTLVLARAGTPINVTSAGSGTITVTKNAEPRYEAAGLIVHDRDKDRIIDDIRSAMAGRAVYAGSVWNLQAGAYDTPTLTFTADDFVGGIAISTRLPARSLFNAVKGLFTGLSSFDQPTDYPLVSSAVAETEDGGQRIQDIDFPLTSRASAAQRLARIEINRARQQITVEATLNLTGMQVRPANVVNLTLPRMGWSGKPFEVASWAFVAERDAQGVPIFTCPVTLRETASTVFDFDPNTEESAFDPAPNTLLRFREMAAPTGLMLSSGAASLFVKLDGTVISRIKAVWTDPGDPTLDRIETQFKRSADASYEDGPVVRPGVQLAYMIDVEDGITYDVRIRAASIQFATSDYVEVTGHTVVGKTEPPGDVASLEMFQLGESVTFSWTQVPDIDLAGYILKYWPQEEAFDWDTAIPLTEITRGTLITNSGLPAGSWTVGIKAIDTSGNESVTEQTAVITVISTLEIVALQINAPYWRGTLTNLRRHDVSGTLVPESADADSTGNNFDVFDNFVLNPATNPSYETEDLDLGADQENLRVGFPRSISLGPGETGQISTTRQLDYRANAGSYDGFEDWPVPAKPIGSFQFLKGKLIIGTTINVPFVRTFRIQADAQTRRESAQGVAVGSGGETITFGEAFVNTPSVTVTPVDLGSPPVPVVPVLTALNNASFTVTLYRVSDGVAVAGTVNWSAEGA